MEPASSLGTIGKYRLMASLRQGATSRVYLTLMTTGAGFTKLMVVKILRDDAASGRAQAAHDAARRVARLVHPNIVHTYEVCEVDGQPFLAMEYLDGQTLRTLRERALAAGGLPLSEELRILAEAARGLHHAHALRDLDAGSLVHGAVDPRHVFVTYDGQVKLLGFETSSMQPASAATHGRDADLRGLGAMLWQAVTGEPLDATDSEAEHGVRTLRPDVPAALARIVDRAVARRAHDRFPDAGALAGALDGLLAACGEPPCAKNLSQQMVALFCAQRAAMQTLIERQVQRSAGGTVRLGEATGNLPRVISDPGKPARPRTWAARTFSRNLGLVNGAIPAHAATKSSRVPLWSALIVAALLGAGAASFVRDSATAGAKLVPTLDVRAPVAAQPATTATPTAGLAGAQPTQQVRPTTTVRVALRALPPEASATLDGAPVALPFMGEFPISATPRTLEVTADGYRSVRRTITFDCDAELQVELLPRVGRRRSPAATLPRDGATTPARQLAPHVAGSVLTPELPAVFDPVDPYATQS